MAIGDGIFATTSGIYNINKLRDYYDGVKTRAWKGQDLNISVPGQYTANNGLRPPIPGGTWPTRNVNVPFQGPSGQERHFQHTAKLGVYELMNKFKSPIPKAYKTLKYGFAPILPATKAGQIGRAAVGAARMGAELLPGKQLPLYADKANPLSPGQAIKNMREMIKGDFKSKQVDKRFQMKLRGSSTEEGGDSPFMNPTGNQTNTLAKKAPDPSMGHIAQKTVNSGQTGDIVIQTNPYTGEREMVKTADYDPGTTTREFVYEDPWSADMDAGLAEDLIPVMIGTTYVRGIISALTDNITPNWGEAQYVGRPDPVVSYQGFSREITFTLRMAATHPLMLKPMWRKINRIAQYVLPEPDPEAMMTRYSGKLCKLTIGDYIKSQLCAMTALTITPFEDANWEINDAWQDHPPSANHSLSDGFLSNKQIQREKKILPELGKKFIAPKIVDLALGFKI